MSNSPSPSSKFLLDENVKKKLLLFLKSEGYDVTFKPKGLSNGKLAKFSKTERRVFVTNDFDITKFPEEEIFSVVWLRIPQDKEESLIHAFSRLLKETKPTDFEGNLIILYEEEFKIFQLS